MAEWPLAGREAELTRLRALLTDPEARGVVLAGAAGVGKSRLGLECLRTAQERGLAVERISATYATSALPLGAVLLSRPPQQTVAASTIEQTELVHRVAGEFLRRAGGRRLVVMVDDVHWLDQLSAVLVHQLASAGAAFVVLTARTGLAAPDPIVALWKEDIVERMTIGPVSPEVIEPLLCAVLDGPLAGAAVAQFVDRSEGNLLFLREQVRAAVEDGQLTKDAGVWRLSEVHGPQPRLVELVEHRLAGLAPPARQCLEVIAFGEPLELSHAVAGAEENLLDDLEHKGLLSIRADGWGGGKVWLAHPLIGEVLRAGTSLIRARQITRQLSEAAEDRHPTQIDEILRIGSWRLICGGGTPDLMERAATAAYARHDYDLARRLAHGAVEAGAGLTARLVFAEAIAMTGRRAEAERELAALALEATNLDHVSAIANARMANAHLNGDPILGLQVYRHALEAITDLRRRDELTVRRAWLSLLDEGPRGALLAIEELQARPLEHSVLAAMSLVQGAGLACSGRVTEALQVAARGRAAQDAMTEPFDLHHLAQDLFACVALGTAGRFEEWQRRAEDCYREAVADRSASMQLFYSLQRARVNLRRGLAVTAGKLAGEAVGIAHQINDMNLLPPSLTTLAEALALQGKTERAARALAELDSLRVAPWNFAEAGIARAWLAVANGDLRAAYVALQDEAQRSLGFDDLQLATRALHDMVRIGYATAAHETLTDLEGRVEGDLVATEARHAAAAILRDGQMLQAVGDAFCSMGAPLLAAEAYCDAAVALRGAGDPKPAAALMHKSAALLAQCEGVTTPATQSLSFRAQLTPAERNTAMLAAQGRSNKDIAVAEQVSVRTVEARLQVAYTKLGISSRKDLAVYIVGGLLDA